MLLSLRHLSASASSHSNLLLSVWCPSFITRLPLWLLAAFLAPISWQQFRGQIWMIHFCYQTNNPPAVIWHPQIEAPTKDAWKMHRLGETRYASTKGFHVALSSTGILQLFSFSVPRLLVQVDISLEEDDSSCSYRVSPLLCELHLSRRRATMTAGREKKFPFCSCFVTWPRWERLRILKRHVHPCT